VVAPPKIAKLSNQGKYELVDAKIRLSVFLGILNQAIGKSANAEEYYRTAVNKELEEIVKRSGYKLSGNLNNFYYLKNIWLQISGEQSIEKLIPIYTYLQNYYLNELKIKHDNELVKMQNEIKELQGAKQNLSTQLNKITSETRKIKLQFALSIFHYLSIAVGLILIVVGVGITAYRHAVTITRYQAFAFVFKFMEGVGWVKCFSIILIPVGILEIAFSQFMLIVQSGEQQIEVIKRKGFTAWGGGGEIRQSLAFPGETGPVKLTRCPQCHKEYAGEVSGQFCEECGAKLP